MKKSSVILLRIAAILSLVISFIFLFQCVGLLFNLFGFKDMYVQILQEISGASQTDIQAQVYMGVFDGFIGLFLNSYCAGTFYRISRANGIPIGSAKAVLYMGVLQCFFIISILPGIFAIIVGWKLSKEEKQIVNRPRENQTSFDDVANQINELKKQKEKGEITQMQYDRALNNIIEKSAKSQIENQSTQENNDKKENNNR